MPLIEDKVALRVALLTNFNDGTLKVNSPGHEQRLNDAGTGTVRASLRWTPTDDVTVDVIGSYFRTKGAGPAPKFEGDFCQYQAEGSPICAPRPTPLAISWPGAGPGSDFTGAIPNPDNPYLGTANEPQRMESTVYTATVLVEWARDNWKFDSITGYQSTNFFLHRDQDTSSLPISTLDLTDKSVQISQEFLFSSTWDKPFDYTLGTNYQYDHTPRTQITIPNAQNTTESENWRLFPAIGPIPFIDFEGISLVDGCPIPTAPYPNVPSDYSPSCPPIKPIGVEREDFINVHAESRNHVFGLFGNLSWRPIDDLKLTAGGRFSYTYREWNDKSWSQTYSPFFGSDGLQIEQVGIPQDHDWKSGTWKVSADYQLMDDHMLWSSVGTGSRAGGFNFSEEQPFGAEDILAVEAGTKSTFFDNRLTLNLTGFWYDWDNPQLGSTEDALPVVKNAPSAKSYGFEFEWRALPVDELALNGSFGWQDAMYDEDFFSTDSTIYDFDEPNPADRSPEVNLNGNRMPRTPRFTVSVGAQYMFDFDRWGKVTPRVDFYFRDDVAFRQYDNPKDIQASYTRTDARISWFSESDQYWVELFARNLENNAVKTNQEVSSQIYRLHYYDAPINGGVRFGYYFR
jgi:hypothetical protein